jgi:hypothetical protein
MNLGFRNNKSQEDFLKTVFAEKTAVCKCPYIKDKENAILSLLHKRNITNNQY